MASASSISSAAGTSSNSIDVASVVSTIMAIENKPLEVLKVKTTDTNLVISDLANVKSKIEAFQTALLNFENISTYNTVASTSSNPSQISATATNGAAQGTYDIKVSQSALQTKINIGGTNSVGNLSAVTVDARGFNITIGGVISNYTAGTSTTKLEDLSAWINSLNSSVTANIVAVNETSWNLSIQGKKSGTSNAISIANLNQGNVVDNGNGTGSTLWSNGITETFDSNGVRYSSGITQVNNLGFSTALNSSSIAVQLSQGGLLTPVGDYTLSGSTNSITITNGVTGKSQTIVVPAQVIGTNALNFSAFGLQVNYQTSNQADSAEKIIADLTSKTIQVKAPNVTGSNISLSLASVAKNALLNVNGIEYTRNTNSINDIIPNISLSILGNVESSQAPYKSIITITKGEDRTASTIQGLVSAYNEVINLYKTLTKNPTTSEKGGDFASKKSLLSYIDNFKARMSQGFRYGGTTNMSFSEVGFSLQVDGTAKFDSLKQASAIANGLQEKLASGAVVGYISNSDTLKINIRDVLKVNGTIDTQITGKKKELELIGKSTANLQARLERIQRNYTTQYSQLNTLLFNLNNTSNALTSSLTALTNMNASK